MINIITNQDFENDYVDAGLTLGNYDFQQYQFSAGFNLRKTSLIIQETNTNTNGYREQSGFKNNNINFKLRHTFAEDTKLNVLLNYSDSPYAGDAGGLTLDEANENGRQARARNVEYMTEEAISQFKAGANFSHKWGNSTFNSYGFFSTRNFYGLLPFEFGGIVDLDRNYYGLGSNYSIKTDKNISNNTFQIGIDFANQEDDRKRYRNLIGQEGDKTLDQIESFSAIGFYLLDHLEINKFLFRAGIRFDFNKIEANDAYTSNGDQSGKSNLNTLNPTIGLSYRLRNNQALYTNFSTSFETPVLSELSSNPTNEGGFNESLNAQKAKNYEIGYKFKNSKTSLELALFYISTKDDILPYEIEAFPGRTFFRNAGKTIRKGVELSSSIAISENLNASMSYTYSDFKFDEYISPNGDFKGMELPGIPKHMGALTFLYQNKRGLSIRLNNQLIGDLYVNDANSVKDKSYFKSDLNLGYEWEFNKLKLKPFLGINNIFDTNYNDNIRINAFGGRYYEPAPGFNVFGGIRFSHSL